MDEDVRLAIYTSFASTGRAPALHDVARALGHPADEIKASLRRLATARHIVLDSDDRLLMAHPFSSIPLGFSVMGRSALFWGGCAWDAFAIPHLVDDEPEVLVATRCPGCGVAHAWVVGRDAPPEGGEVAHFLVPVARMWHDVVHTCGHQRLFCGPSCVDAWLASTGRDKGYVMDLATLWRLSRGWYEGRLQRGYTRRDPSSAAAYFRDVGLRGPFWGL